MNTLLKTDYSDSQTLASTNTYEETWLQLLCYSKALEQEMGNRFRKHFKQSLTRFDLLSQLTRQDPGRVTIGKLAQQLLASNGNITGLVDRMIAEGLIERHSRPGDRRSVEVGLTDKGRELYRQMASAHADWTQSLMSERLTVEDAEQLTALLKRANKAFC